MKRLFILLLCVAVIDAYAYNLAQCPNADATGRGRVFTYGGLGAVAGAVIGNQMDGDRTEKRAIGAGVGAVTGAILASRENNRQRDLQERKARRASELEIRRMEEQRRHDIILGRTVSDAEILRERHEVEKLEHEIARIEQEKAAAEARARRIRELKQRKAQLERELGGLR